MLNTTVSRLKCPSCGGSLKLAPEQASPEQASTDLIEVRTGRLACAGCGASFLILAGVALLVEDTYDYLMTHVKGISRVVADDEIPVEFRGDFEEAKAELETEHLDDDLEAERVNALYFMNHYLRADSGTEWWKPLAGAGSPLIDSLVREHWDRGPFAQIREWAAELAKSGRFKAALELGCGMGGLRRVLAPHCDFYLGADSSFAGIALARHLELGVPHPGTLRIPEDLLQGGVSREIDVPIPKSFDGRADFVVMDLQAPALARGWDLTISLNMIDMLDEPEALPALQHELTEKNGIAIQSCPYIWHGGVAKELREKLPAELRGDSARAVEWLYRQAGFEIEKSVAHRPWLFFKHVRQLELYSVHMFTARKRA